MIGNRPGNVYFCRSVAIRLTAISSYAWVNPVSCYLFGLVVSSMAGRVDKEDLLVSLREKHGQDFVSMADLEHPTSEFMMRYFATFVAQLGIDIKAMTNQDLIQSDSFRDIGPFIQVYMAVKNVCPVPKYVANFSVLTLMEPKPDDIIFVAAMDNFYDYYFQRLTDYLEPRVQELDALKETLQEQEQHKMELQHHLNDGAAARSKRVVEQAQAERQIEVVDGELQELHLQEQQLEAAAVEQEKALKELRQDIEANRIRREQLEEQEEAQQQLQALREELQQLQEQQTVQDRELADKHSELQEKASRQRFLQECIEMETRAMDVVVELVELAAQVEQQYQSLQESETKTERALRELEAEEKKLKNLDVKKAAMEAEIAAQEKIVAVSVKEIKDLERKIQDVQDQVFQHQHDILSLEKKTKVMKENVQEKKEELFSLDEMFQKAHDEMYEKAASFKKDLTAALQQ